MNELIILVGVPGSGKTTRARQICETFPYRRISRDDIRAMLGASYTDEGLVAKLRDVCLAQTLLAGYSVVLDDTNLEEHARRGAFNIAQVCGARVSVIQMDTPLDECIRRDSLREKPVGEERIREMWSKRP